MDNAIGMIEAGWECLDIALQLHAVAKAIVNVKKTLVHDHIDHCLEHSVDRHKGAHGALEEFKEITKYL